MSLASRSLFNLMILVGISFCWQEFLILSLIIIFSTSLQVVFLKLNIGSNALVLILAMLIYLLKDLVMDVIGLRSWLHLGKNLCFGMHKTFNMRTILKKNLLNVSQSSLSLDDNELFCQMVGHWRKFGFIYNQNHCQRFWLS